MDWMLDMDRSIILNCVLCCILMAGFSCPCLYLIFLGKSSILNSSNSKVSGEFCLEYMHWSDAQKWIMCHFHKVVGFSGWNIWSIVRIGEEGDLNYEIKKRFLFDMLSTISSSYFPIFCCILYRHSNYRKKEKNKKGYSLAVIVYL